MSNTEPKNWDELFTLRQEEKQWIQAAEEEMHALCCNDTWDLVPLLQGHKALGCRWIFKLKYDEHQRVKYKARLVSKGCKNMEQKYGTDYDETLSQW